MCDLSVTELRAQRAERNTLDLWESTVADAQAGYMTLPVPVHHLDLSLISLTRRLPVREERPKGTRTRSVDHFTESGVNPATRPQDALTHETVDHFISLLVMYMSVGVAPLIWKRVVAQAFGKVPIKHDATDLSLGRLLACRRVVGVAALVDAIRVHVCQLCVAPYRQSPQGHHGQSLLGAHVQVCGRLLRLRPGGLHGHGGLLPDDHVQSARLHHGP